MAITVVWHRDGGDGEDSGDKDRQWVGLEWRGEGSPCAIYGVLIALLWALGAMIMHIGQRILDYCYILLHKGLFGPLI